MDDIIAKNNDEEKDRTRKKIAKTKALGKSVFLNTERILNEWRTSLKKFIFVDPKYLVPLMDGTFS